jgi:hypothetical protein
LKTTSLSIGTGLNGMLKENISLQSLMTNPSYCAAVPWFDPS